MLRLLEIKVLNFMSIESEIVFSDLKENILLAGLFETLKKNFWKAITFGLGGSVKDLGIERYDDLKGHADEATSVSLTLKYDGVNYTVQRTLARGEPQFTIDHLPVDDDDEMEAYQTFLKERLKFDLNKQILLWDSTNVKLIWNMTTTDPGSLMCALADVARQLNAMNMHRDTIDKQIFINQDLVKNLQVLKDVIRSLESVLPDIRYDIAFAAFTISNLKRQQADRIAKKDEYATVQAELHATNANIRNFEATIATETELRDRKAIEKNDLILIMRTRGLPPRQEDSVLCVLDNRLKEATICQKNALDLLEKLMRRREAVESNIAFMSGASGTNRKSDMISKENVRKLYSLYHGKDELEMDKLELQLLKLESQLKTDAHTQETFDYFEKFLPQRKSKGMDPAETIEQIFSECNAALKGIFDPNAYMQLTDELKIEKLRSLIPSDRGFLLCSAFQPIADEHRLFIDHILFDYKYTIVLYKNDRNFILNKLEKECPGWFLIVKFLVISDLPNPNRGEYVAPPDHWLNYCNFTNTTIDLTSRRKLMSHMGKQLEIKRVATHDEVKEAFRNLTKKYVASMDGQLIYTTHVMGFDAIKYFRPGKKAKDMQFPAASQRLQDGVQKLGEFMSTLVETENVPRDRPVSNSNVNKDEVERLRKEIAERKDRMNTQLEALHIQLNAPYESPNVNDYADKLVVEQRKLDDINEQGKAAEKVYDEAVEKCQKLSDEIRSVSSYLTHKRDLDTIELDIVKLNKTIRANEQQLKEQRKTVGPLQLKTKQLEQTIQNLQDKTFRTVLQAHQANVDWTTVHCVTEPPTLWQDIKNGIYVDPMVISTHFDDMTDRFDPDVFYAKEERYTVLERHRNNALLVHEKIIGSVDIINAMQRRNERLQNFLTIRFEQFSLGMTDILNDIGREVHPNAGIEYKFHCDVLNDGTVPAKILAIHIDGDVVGFASLSKSDKVRTSWVLFAAFTEYAKTPFAFINLEELDKETVALIHPIARRMSRSTQLFIDSSSVNYSHFAQVLYGIHVKEFLAGPNIVGMIRHDGGMFINDERDGYNVDDRQDERDGDNVDDRQDERDGDNVDDRQDERDGDNVDDREDERDGDNVDDRQDERDGDNVDDQQDERDGDNVDDREDERDGDNVR